MNYCALVATTALSFSFTTACDFDSEQGASGPGDYLATVDVDSVIDGDTIRVKVDGERTLLRILGIDSPETGGYQGEECWGAEATAFASSWLADQTIDVFTDSSQGERDQFDRLLVYVLIGGDNYSLMAAEAGMAKSFIFADKPLLIAEELKEAVAKAQAEERGMWGPPCHYSIDSDS